MFYIASLKHTQKHHEHITWWGKDSRGYTPVVGDYIGEYPLWEALRLNDGVDCLAVPVDVVKSFVSPEPYWKPGAKFYDQVGPVVDNTRALWNRLIAASLAEGRHSKPKPEVFRGSRRGFLTWRQVHGLSFTPFHRRRNGWHNFLRGSTNDVTAEA
jgi:hypothetical protein